MHGWRREWRKCNVHIAIVNQYFVHIDQTQLPSVTPTLQYVDLKSQTLLYSLPSLSGLSTKCTRMFLHALGAILSVVALILRSTLTKLVLFAVTVSFVVPRPGIDGWEVWLAARAHR